MPSSAASSRGSERALYAGSAAKVAVAQIAQSVGICTAQPAAILSLSDIAGRYLEALGKAAASAANSQGRTECNLLDVVVALEELASPRGFPGASAPRTPFLQSAVLQGIISYVDAVEEVPFFRSNNRGGGSGAAKKPKYLSFAQAGKDPPPHVPRWLPVFPESTGKEAKKLRIREDLWPWNKGLESELNPGNGEVVRTEVRKLQGGVLPSNRPRVRFKLGLGREQVVEAGGNLYQMDGKGTSECLPWRWENEEGSIMFISSTKDLWRYDFSVQPFVGLGISSSFPD